MNGRLAGTKNGRHIEWQACWHNKRQAQRTAGTMNGRLAGTMNGWHNERLAQ